ncbi:hypothetical protein Ngar_c19050 [Candidatus Nitrososphaera gargensis Ga9.2]|uniref:Uncharacterized protein n=1 Tax=Nitrososphaera gargensis (strain Ga9.2) TaxID=1237085 RepID=K0IKD0_NITGG|nr:hypothetical protein [Candidatus Nitrososphaera gargensis]AFU58837.1 hypothetical protein Ngar_c19050 [Candidatus Nitrososphaera gargensis Ga9.2]
MLYDGDDGEGLGLSSIQHPACQVAGCFEPASVYVVIKESDVNVLNLDAQERQMIMEKDAPAADVNAFKLILYLCARHDYDLKYLLKENELEITKRRHLVLKETE